MVQSGGCGYALNLNAVNKCANAVLMLSQMPLKVLYRSRNCGYEVQLQLRTTILEL
jgi:hypothetical protein